MKEGLTASTQFNRRDRSGRELGGSDATINALDSVIGLITDLRRQASNVFVVYSNSATLVKHNQQKREMAFDPDGPDQPHKPEYFRYGNEFLSLCEVQLARKFDVGSTAIFPSKNSALVASILTYVDTRMVSASLAAENQRTLIADRRFLEDPYWNHFFLGQLPNFGIKVAAVPHDQIKTIAHDVFLVVMKADGSTDLNSVAEIGKLKRRNEAGFIVDLLEGAQPTSVVAKLPGVSVVTSHLEDSQAKLGIALGGDSARYASVDVKQIRERRGLFGALPGMLEQATAILPNVKLNGDASTFESRAKALAELNPLKERLILDCESKLALLEQCDKAVLFGSGMAAVTTTLSTLLKVGDHVVMSPNSYRNTLRFGRESLKARGVRVSEVNFSDEINSDGVEVSAEQALRSAITKDTKVLYVESPTIPYLRVTDFGLLAKIAKEFNLKIVIDSTLASPFNQDLSKIFEGLEYVVVHSATKYLSGDNKVLAGAVMGREDTIEKIRANSFSQPGTFEVADILERLESAQDRVIKQNQISLQVAQALETDPELSDLVGQVWYPGLESHPDYSVAKKQMTGFGGLIYFSLKVPSGQAVPSVDDTRLFLDASKLPNAASFGGDFTMMQVPVDISYSEFDRGDRLKRFGVDDNVLRLAVGWNDSVESIVERLRSGARALKAARVVQN